MRLALAFVLALLVPLTSGAQSRPPPTKAQVTVLSAYFGVVHRTPKDGFSIQRSSTIKAVPGTEYGFLIIADVAPGPHVYREELVVPAAVEHWGEIEHADHFTIAPDRKAIVYEVPLAVAGGDVRIPMLSTWFHRRGDPLGKYAIRVYMDGSLLGEFLFELIEPARPDPHVPSSGRRSA